MRRRGRLLLAAVTVSSLAGTACGGGGDSAGAGNALRDLAELAELRQAFDADRGKPRLILLLSPT